MIKKSLKTLKIALTCVALGNLHIMQPLHAMQCDHYDFVNKSFSVRPGQVNVTTCEVDLQPSSIVTNPVFTAFAGALMGACLNTYGPKAWKKFKEALYSCLGKHKWDHTKEVKSYIPLSLRSKGAFATYVSEVDKFLTSNGFQRNVIAYTNSGRFGCLTDEEVFLGYRYNGPYTLGHSKVYLDITFNPTGKDIDTFHQVHERHGSIKEDPTIKTFDEDVNDSLDQRNSRPRYTQLGLHDKRKLEKSVLFKFLKEKREESTHETASAAASSSRNSDEFPCFLAYLDGRKREVRGKFYLDNVKHVLHVAFSPIDSFYPDNFLPTSAMLTFH